MAFANSIRRKLNRNAKLKSPSFSQSGVGYTSGLGIPFQPATSLTSAYERIKGHACSAFGHHLYGRQNARQSITAAMALRLEALGWSDAEHWMRMQASYDLAKERRRAVA